MPFKPEVIDELLKDYDIKKPELILGPDGLLKQLSKALLERALQGEMNHHLGYKKNERAEQSGNYRNGKTSKTVITKEGEIEIDVPRDRQSSFEPAIVKKNQRRFEDFDNKILGLYSRGMTVREIQGYLHELYGVDVSPDLISNVTDEVREEVEAWQTRPVDAMYLVLYIDAMFFKVRDNGHIQNKAIYLVVGINIEGKKEVLGLWIAATEGAKFWLLVLNELKQRGLQDALIVCGDGLKGLPEAINAALPHAQVQLCIVHMIRNSLKFVPWKDRKTVAADLKNIYTAINEQEAYKALIAFREKWDRRYPMIGESWERNWSNIIPFLGYPPEIRKVIYTTNTIESINRGVRKITKNRSVFPDDKSAIKLVYLALKNLSRKWTMPLHHWFEAITQFRIIFGERLEKHLR